MLSQSKILTSKIDFRYLFTTLKDVFWRIFSFQHITVFNKSLYTKDIKVARLDSIFSISPLVCAMPECFSVLLYRTDLGAGLHMDWFVMSLSKHQGLGIILISEI